MCEKPLEVETYKGIKVEYWQDPDSGNPRKEWDNLGTLVIMSRDWGLGYEGRINPRNCDSIEELRKAIVEEQDPAVILPVYYGDNGSNPSTLRVQDYRVNGYIYVTRKDAMKEYSVRRITPKIKETIEKVLKGEIETLEQWINGEVYRYNIPELNDSCWGFYGYEYLKDEVHGIIDRHLQRQNESAWLSLSAAPVMAE
jgi:hypothetical protein